MVRCVAVMRSAFLSGGLLFLSFLFFLFLKKLDDHRKRVDDNYERCISLILFFADGSTVNRGDVMSGFLQLQIHQVTHTLSPPSTHSNQPFGTEVEVPIYNVT